MNWEPLIVPFAIVVGVPLFMATSRIAWEAAHVVIFKVEQWSKRKRGKP